MSRSISGPFGKYLVPRFAGKPIDYLEIGVFQGASFQWMLNNILTHPDCTADLVDPWLPFEAEPDRRGNPRIYTTEMMTAARQNVHEIADNASIECNIHHATSNAFFEQNWKGYDLILIDGLHTYDAVLSDALSAHSCIKRKRTGVIAFDDTNVREVRKAVERFVKVVRSRSKVKQIYDTRRGMCYSFRHHRRSKPTWFCKGARWNFER
jgi:predicted O-methyltransferase YrrM